jgi:hypothetical protein
VQPRQRDVRPHVLECDELQPLVQFSKRQLSLVFLHESHFDPTSAALQPQTAQSPQRSVGDVARTAQSPQRSVGDVAQTAQSPQRSVGDVAQTAQSPQRSVGDVAQTAHAVLRCCSRSVHLSGSRSGTRRATIRVGVAF